MEHRFLTLKEAADLANLRLSYIYRMSSEGRLPGKVTWGSKTVRVDREKLLAWLEERAENGQPDNGSLI